MSYELNYRSRISSEKRKLAEVSLIKRAVDVHKVSMVLTNQLNLNLAPTRRQPNGVP